MRALRLILLLAPCLGVTAARADRDIVYAARYYAPPGSHRTSHFHLYRINPNGTGRTQLTFGQMDESAPRWSPDGRQILFTREASTGHSLLCLVGARGGAVAKVMEWGKPSGEDGYLYRWSSAGRAVAVMYEDYEGSRQRLVFLLDTQTRQARRLPGATDFFWSPNGRRGYVVRDKGGDQILTVKTGASVAVADSVEHPVWLTNSSLAGLAADPKTGKSFVRVIDGTGRDRKRLVPRFPASVETADSDPAESGNLLFCLPRAQNAVVYAVNEHNSTVGTDFLFLRLDLPTGAMRVVADGQFLVWNGKGMRFCTAPGRDTLPYSKWPDGSVRTVWAAPLQVGQANGGGKVKTISHGLVWVTGADWRRKTL